MLASQKADQASQKKNFESDACTRALIDFSHLRLAVSRRRAGATARRHDVDMVDMTVTI